MKNLFLILAILHLVNGEAGTSVYEQDPTEVCTGEVSGEPIDYGEMC